MYFSNCAVAIIYHVIIMVEILFNAIKNLFPHIFFCNTYILSYSGSKIAIKKPINNSYFLTQYQIKL